MAEEVSQTKKPTGSETGQSPVETEILNVSVEREGQQVSARWGLHPHLKEGLTPEEWKELTEVMGKVTDLVGKRFSEVLAQGGNEPQGTA